MLLQSNKLMILQQLNALYSSKAAPVRDMKADGRRRIKVHSCLALAVYRSGQPHITSGE